MFLWLQWLNPLYLLAILMKLIKNISFIFIVIITGFLLRDFFVDRLIQNSSNSNFSQVAKSFSSNPELSIWGSSTAYINFDAKTLQNKLGLSCYNFGISGAFFNQLDHLKSFAKNNKNKTIILVVNPYEFKEDVNSKLNEASFFTPFSHQLGNNLNYLFGWRQIYHFNAEHWSIIFQGKDCNEFDDYGNHLINKEFNSSNGYHEDVTPFNFSDKKITAFKEMASLIENKNNLIIILPPYLGKTKFEALKTELGGKIMDYSNWSKNQQDFHDYIHLNKDAAIKLSKKLANDLKPYLK